MRLTLNRTRTRALVELIYEHKALIDPEPPRRPMLSVLVIDVTETLLKSAQVLPDVLWVGVSGHYGSVCRHSDFEEAVRLVRQANRAAS